LFLISTMIAGQTGRIEAQSSPRPGEGVAPAAIGQPCTGPSALRGSTVAAPKAGDVATLPQLCIGGVSAASLPHAPTMLPPATTVGDAQLVRDESLPALVALGAPQSAAIDIRTANGNWTHLFAGAFWHAPTITSKGELQAIDSGHAEFSVAAALGYFAVVMPRFLARVKGTIFDVDYEPGASASFSVSEGSVAIVRLTAIYLQAEARTVDGIRQTDVISANGKSTIQYKLPMHVERTFKNSQEAQQAFNQELTAATADGDPQLVDDALNNIQLITGHPVALAPGQIGNAASATAGTQSILPAIAFAAAAAATGVIVSTMKTSTPQPQSTPTGTVTLTSTARATATPVPATVKVTPRPVPSPIAIPSPLALKPGPVPFPKVTPH
jgi:hypothetical protein